MRTFLATGDSDPAGTLARHCGFVLPGQQITAGDRCFARQLHNASQNQAGQLVQIPSIRAPTFSRRVCNTALLQSLLLVNGTTINRPQFTAIEQNTLASFEAA